MSWLRPSKRSARVTRGRGRSQFVPGAGQLHAAELAVGRQGGPNEAHDLQAETGEGAIEDGQSEGRIGVESTGKRGIGVDECRAVDLIDRSRRADWRQHQRAEESEDGGCVVDLHRMCDQRLRRALLTMAGGHQRHAQDQSMKQKVARIHGGRRRVRVADRIRPHRIDSS